MSLLSWIVALPFAIGALWLTASHRDSGSPRLYRRPRLACLTFLACAIDVARRAHEKGPGTWEGLGLAALAPASAWWALRAGVQAWVAWRVRRMAEEDRARIEAKRAGREVVK